MPYKWTKMLRFMPDMKDRPCGTTTFMQPMFTIKGGKVCNKKRCCARLNSECLNRNSGCSEGKAEMRTSCGKLLTPKFYDLPFRKTPGKYAVKFGAFYRVPDEYLNQHMWPEGGLWLESP